VKTALLVRLGGLGDLLVALPALSLLRRAFPEASFRLLARRDYGELLRAAGVVDAVSAADDPKWMSLFDRDVPLAPDVLAALARVDWIGGWFHGAPKSALWTGDFLRREGAPASASLPILHAFAYDWKSGIPLSRYFFERTAEFVRAESRPAADFEDCRVLFSEGPRPRERFAVVHPGSGGRLKCWPLERFRIVINALAADGLDGLVVTGEAEAPLEGELAAMELPRGWRRAVQPPLAALADVIRRAAARCVTPESLPT
jgi:heptosyltransferase-3